MKIILAEHIGFCFGVKRAILAAEEAAKAGPIFSFGPLIHNQREIERLEKLGIKTITDKLQIKADDPILIRTHGVGPNVYTALNNEGRKLIDTTCPHVQKAQMAAKEAHEQGYQVIILGDKNHAEVQGIVAWTENKAVVIASLEELKKLELQDKIAFLAQTTEKEEKFAEMVKYLQGKTTDLKVFSTICPSTRIRQEAAAKLAQEVNLMIVIGGKHSSNTKKLAEICRNYVPTFHIERAQELQSSWFLDKFKVGVTAGASTPDWIIKEVVEQMEKINESKVEENFVEIQEKIDLQNVQTGDLIKGTIVQVSSDDALIDIGGKSEGVLPVTEFSNEKVDLKEHLQVGDEILVEVIKVDKEGNYILSRKNAYYNELMDKLEKAMETGEIIEAPVVEIVKGGLLVDVGIRGFVPASQVERFFVEDFQEYLQKTLRLRVIELDKEKRKVVLSQRVVLDEEHQKQKEATLEQLKEGQTKKGVVKRLTNFGAFVDLGGIDGLLHVSEMGWNRVNHPADVLQVGDEVEVYVLSVDKDKEKISLSLKQLLPDPWQEAIQKYQVNSIVTGKVVRLATFGAFVELEPGLDGLVHISRISKQRVEKVADVLTVGQEVKVKIMDIDTDKKRISLSIKDVEEEPEETEYASFLNQQTSEDSVTIRDLIKAGQDDIIKDKIK
ncbi:MAG: bifunctional 4-hydroxy-3-methylbut-2-enyl diphosphate reductase/30S ribosomal protein S1 [Clostridia bacterium]|nr:bifunctional 4-hydroxy-3-methylbut-2-enyl diphosphate reductase/30S ribosomal protein S1 [Clostridia bacterium]